MWSLTQLVNSLFSPQSEVEKAAAVEERYFHTQQQQAMSDSETAAPSQAVRSTSANSGLSSSNHLERAVEKLRGYFTLAKEEIDKGVRSEEWGLNADALAHYKNANRILIEGMGADVNVDPGNPLYGSVKTYKEKMRKWQDKVLERLRVLDNRPGTSGGGSYAQKLVSTPRKAPASVKPASSIPVQPALTRPVSRSRPQPNSANGAVQPLNLKGVDPKLVEAIENDVVDRTPAVKWTDIAGLAKAKLALMEMVILPTIRKDLFQGLRKPARGLLLFGPPGNGKTLLAKAVASESAATFFSISASSLTSKWVGEAEKLVKALFALAAARQPSVIFIDEIDSIMSTRSASEHEASRRLKTEFLVQFDGVISNENDHVIVMAATNRPEELDDALRRRLVKRIYIPLPDADGRRSLLQHLLKGHTAFSLEGPELEKLVKDTDGYSGSDLHALCQEAAMMPLRELGPRVSTIRPDQVRALTHKDFKEALKAIRPSVSKDQLIQYEQFNAEYGSLS
ncbi:hypothetical protein R1sor_020324 [Riccia sorocarpa]|uniref:microtubule-severing ATPase n=1 Tax=Riccia sorocarpa TaxID=122646 RepID=A0ABD3IF79_9MARC